MIDTRTYNVHVFSDPVFGPFLAVRSFAKAEEYAAKTWGKKLIAVRDEQGQIVPGNWYIDPGRNSKGVFVRKISNIPLEERS